MVIKYLNSKSNMLHYFGTANTFLLEITCGLCVSLFMFSVLCSFNANKVVHAHKKVCEHTDTAVKYTKTDKHDDNDIPRKQKPLLTITRIFLIFRIFFTYHHVLTSAYVTTK